MMLMDVSTSSIVSMAVVAWITGLVIGYRLSTRKAC